MSTNTGFNPASTMLKTLTGITLPSIALYLINKDNPRYQEIPQWQRDLFWIIIPPGEDSPIIRIPKPFELGIVFGTVPEHLLAWMDTHNPEELTGAVDAMVRGATPGYIPNMLLPVIENSANYSFFRDRPIVSQSLQGLPAELQSNTYTSETAKAIGKLLKYSPEKVENYIYGYFAGLGNYALDASDAILEGIGMTSPPREPTPTLADMPFIKAFITREPIGSGSESVNKVYEIYEESKARYSAAKEMADKGDEGALEYILEHEEILARSGLVNVVSKFKTLRENKEMIYNNDELSPDDKRAAMDALDEIMTEVARQVVQVFESMK